MDYIILLRLVEHLVYSCLKAKFHEATNTGFE